MPTILQSVAMTVISGTTATRTFASACTPGSRIVAMATQENHTGTFTISDPTNGSYLEDSDGANAVAGNGTAATIRSIENTASTALTVTVTLGASGAGTFVVYELSDCVLDAASSGLGGVGSPTPTAHTGSISAAANASVFSIGGHYPSGAAVDSGYSSAFTETGISISYHWGEYDEDAGAAGTKTLTYGLGSIENWSLAIASYVAAGGGTDPDVDSTSTATPANGSSLTLTGTNFGATQGSGSVTIGGITQTVTAWADTSITVTVARGTNKYGVAVNVVVTDNGLVSSAPYALTSIQPQSGWAFIDLTTPSTTVANRLQTSPDLASGDQIAYDTISGGVTVAADATFTAVNTVTRFQFEAWTTGGWGALGEQILYPQWFAPASADSYELAAKVAQFQALLNPQTWFGPIAVEKWFADELAFTASGPGEIIGTLSVTLGAVTASATGSASINGTVNATLGALTTSAAGSVGVNGTLNSTLGTVTLSGTGSITASGTLNTTLGAVTLTGAGTVGSTANGDLAVTLGAVTASAAGSAGINGSLNVTLGAVSVSGAGSITAAGTLNTTLGAVTLTGAGVSGNTVTGTLTSTLGAVTTSAAASASINGTLNRTLGAVTAAGAGSVAVTGTLNVTLGAVTLFTGGLPDIWSGGNSAIGNSFIAAQTGRIGTITLHGQQGRIGL